MPITFTTPLLTNKTQIAGFQGDVRTAALNNGGYVSAWESNISGTSTVHFQRHDALGNRVGAGQAGLVAAEGERVKLGHGGEELDAVVGHFGVAGVDLLFDGARRGERVGELADGVGDELLGVGAEQRTHGERVGPREILLGDVAGNIFCRPTNGHG